MLVKSFEWCEENELKEKQWIKEKKKLNKQSKNNKIRIIIILIWWTNLFCIFMFFSYFISICSGWQSFRFMLWKMKCKNVDILFYFSNKVLSIVIRSDFHMLAISTNHIFILQFHFLHIICCFFCSLIVLGAFFFKYLVIAVGALKTK